MIKYFYYVICKYKIYQNDRLSAFPTARHTVWDSFSFLFSRLWNTDRSAIPSFHGVLEFISEENPSNDVANGIHLFIENATETQ